MFNIIKKLLPDKTLSAMSVPKEQELEFITTLLKEHPELLPTFQSVYEKVDYQSDNLFQTYRGNDRKSFTETTDSQEVVIRELLQQSFVWDSETGMHEPKETITGYLGLKGYQQLPKKERPQFTGRLVKQDVDSDHTNEALLFYYQQYKETGDIQMYHRFRQGIDILDISPLLYELLSLDPNAMSKWLPKIKEANDKCGFFNIPKTKILKVPLTLLQTTRVYEYNSLTPETMNVINEYIKRVFELDTCQSYFIKTGTFSSKFEFRNAKVQSGQEVNELGSYLWFIQHQANQLASPLNNRSVYGVSSNNEWVVREYIEDKENNPTIYNGLPLHTEYRVFVDFDTQEVIGLAPYWDPDTMKDHFKDCENNPQKAHDYVVYSVHEATLMKRYEENKDLVREKVQELVEKQPLSGQWSIDIMQNGDEFWLIDMARASESALIQYVESGKLKVIQPPFMLEK